MPAHITLVFPFVPVHLLDGTAVASLAELFETVPEFEFALGSFGSFPGTLYLVPEPAGAFVSLTESIVRRFPDSPPYGGAFESIVPHLTVAHGDGALMAEAEADVSGCSLPIRSVASEALLLEEVEPDGGSWHVRARLPFAAAATEQ